MVQSDGGLCRGIDSNATIKSPYGDMTNNLPAASRGRTDSSNLQKGAIDEMGEEREDREGREQ